MREYTRKLMEMFDEGIMDRRQLVLELLNWMSEADVQDFYEQNYSDEAVGEDEDEDEEDLESALSDLRKCLTEEFTSRSVEGGIEYTKNGTLEPFEPEN